MTNVIVVITVEPTTFALPCTVIPANAGTHLFVGRNESEQTKRIII